MAVVVAGKTRGYDSRLSQEKFDELITEGALQFSEHLRDGEFNRNFVRLTGTMVALQRDLKKIIGTFGRLNDAALEFMESFKANSPPNAKFPQCMELHMVVLFTDDLRQSGVEVNGPWSSEHRITVYTKIQKIVHRIVNRFNNPPAVIVEDYLFDESAHDDEDLLLLPQGALETPFEFMDDVTMPLNVLRAWRSNSRPYVAGGRQPFPDSCCSANVFTPAATWSRKLDDWWESFSVVDECAHLVGVVAVGGSVAANRRRGLATTTKALRDGSAIYFTGETWPLSHIAEHFPDEWNYVLSLPDGWCLRGVPGRDKWMMGNAGGPNSTIRFNQPRNDLPPMGSAIKSIGYYSAVTMQYIVRPSRAPSTRVVEMSAETAKAVPRETNELEKSLGTAKNPRRLHKKKSEAGAVAVAVAVAGQPVFHSIFHISPPSHLACSRFSSP